MRFRVQRAITSRRCSRDLSITALLGPHSHYGARRGVWRLHLERRRSARR